MSSLVPGTYSCKDFGLARDQSELMTLQNSDYRSEHGRLARQVEALCLHPGAMMASIDNVRRTPHRAVIAANHQSAFATVVREGTR